MRLQEGKRFLKKRYGGKNEKVTFYFISTFNGLLNDDRMFKRN